MPRKRRSPKYYKLVNVLSDAEYEGVLQEAREYLRSHLQHWQVEPDGKQVPTIEWLTGLAKLYQKELQRDSEANLADFAQFHGVPFEALLPHVELEANSVDSRLVLAYYSRPEIQRELMRHARARQLLLHYNGPYLWGFSSAEDIVPLAFWILHRTGRWPSFHASVASYDELGRPHRDVVFEIDHENKDWTVCFEQTRPLIQLLQEHEIPFRIKYSGNASAHVIVPAEVLPPESEGYYGELYRYVDSQLEHGGRLDMTFLHDAHHLLRLPYALNEFTGLASVPIPRDAFDSFTPEQAHPSVVQVLAEWWPLKPSVRESGQQAVRRMIG